MFSMRIGDSFGSRGVSCVKLPAAVAFPTDGRLLQRIEESRRALPATNNMKPLWKSRGPGCSPVASAPCEGGVGTPSIISVSLAAVDKSHSRVVPLARAAGSIARAREGISVSAA